MTDFICVYFGGNQSDPWWSITARGFASLKDAEKHGLYMMPTAGVFGFAVIAEHEDDWVLYTGYSMLPPNASVSLDDLGNYNVQCVSSTTVHQIPQTLQIRGILAK